MGPSSPISELDRKNVTLICDLESGYPKTLSRVNWYMDGNLLKRLPDCPTDQNPNPNLELCDDIDPSRLLLEHAGADQASRELNGTVKKLKSTIPENENLQKFCQKFNRKIKGWKKLGLAKFAWITKLK